MKKIRVLGLVLLVLVLVATAFLAACATQTAAPTAAPKTTAPTAAPAQPTVIQPTAAVPTAANPAVKTITLKAVSNGILANKGSPAEVVFGLFIDRINERGAAVGLKINYLGSTEVFPDNMQFTAAQKGLVDIVECPGAYHQTIVPEDAALGITELTPTQEREVGFYDLLVKVNREKAGVVPIGRAGYNSRFYVFTNVKVQKIEDFKGLKFRSNGAYDPFFKPMGITTIEMAAGDIYTAMQRNMVVGFGNPVYISARWHYDEVTKYRIDDPWWNSPDMYYFNMKTYDGLTPAQQKLIMDTAIELEKVDTPKIIAQFMQDEDKRQLASKMEFIHMDKDSTAKFLAFAAASKWDPMQKLIPADEFATIKKMIGTPIPAK